MTMTTCHDGTDYRITATERIDRAGGASTVAASLLTTGTYQDTTGVLHSIYPLGYPMVWPDVHHHHHYPWHPTVTTELHTHVSGTSAEKPHEVVQRALREIAQAARALRDSAQAMGVPVDGPALEEAIVEKLRAAL